MKSKKYEFRQDNNAVSAVIGVILMVAITVAIAATVYVYVSGMVGEYNDTGSTYTDVDIRTGEIIYKENLIFITRRDIQIEKFVFTVEF